MRRIVLIVTCLLLVVVSCAVDPAARAARERAEEVARQLTRHRGWNSEAVGWSLSQTEGVEVFMVSEKEPGEEGWVLVRVRARGFADDAPPSEAARCFRIAASSWDADVDEVECPPGSPRTFRSPAEIPGRAFDWLKEHLPETPDLDEARRVVRALDLDDRIKQDVALVDGVLGVALREGPGECLFARVRFGTVQVWKPARIQVMPGEGVCSASEAAYGFAQRPPH